mgnify:CR=1 FL=1
MRTCLVKSPHGSGRVTLGRELGKGGEGSVYSIENIQTPGFKDPRQIVGKVYHSPGEGNRRAKIHAMVSKPPGTSSLAWPMAALYDGVEFIGYIMPKLDSSKFRDWSDLSNAKSRRQAAPDFDFKYALHACRNLAAAIDSAHQVGAVLGDINESNDMVGSDASILVVDTDSAQITASNGRVFPCLVGKPEYTAPEISKGSFQDNPRTVDTDVFAYAIMVFQMLTGGAHPSDGKYTGNGDAPDTRHRILRSAYPALRNTPGFESVSRIPGECVPSSVSTVITSTVANGPGSRPSLHDFVNCYDDVLSNLVKCPKIGSHWYDRRDHAVCPWCLRRDAGLNDTWGPPVQKPQPVSSSGSAISQSTLPSVQFSSGGGSSAPMVTRRRLAPASSNGAAQAPTAHAATPPRTQQPVNGSPASSTQPVPQAHNASSSIPQPQPATPSTPTPAASTPPSKIRGKTVLTYTDGSYGVRPPIATLLRSNPRVAWHCIKNETPNFAHVWWDVDRPLVLPWASALGLLVGLLISGMWMVSLPWLSVYLQYQYPSALWISVLFGIGGLASASTGAVAVVFLFLSSMFDFWKARKQNSNLDVFTRDKWWVTVLRYLPIPFLYGPLLVLVLVAFAIWVAVSAVFGLLQMILESD